MNEIPNLRKYLAIHFVDQREKDQFIIDNADYFRIAYLTQKSKEYSDEIKTLADARAGAKFAGRVTPLNGKKASVNPLQIRAYKTDSTGEVVDALVEYIPFRLGKERHDG